MMSELIIHDRAGVCPVNLDTKRLSAIAESYRKRRVLDMGTGTGYCAVYLARTGARVDATDINDLALRCARENAQRNGVSVHIFRSDYYSDVKDTYDLILFNPPVNANETGLQRIVKAVLRKSFLKSLMGKVARRMYKKKRYEALKEFVLRSREYLNEGGVLLIHTAVDDGQDLKEEGIHARFLEDVFSGSGIYEITFPGPSGGENPQGIPENAADAPHLEI